MRAILIGHALIGSCERGLDGAASDRYRWVSGRSAFSRFAAVAPVTTCRPARAAGRRRMCEAVGVAVRGGGPHG
jgi:hypothetical protein